MKLLLVEDNDALREQMKWALGESYEIKDACSSSTCIEAFKNDSIPLLCLDMGLDNVPDKGLEVIDEILSLNRKTKIIVITANTSQTLGKEAIARGAFDYLVKPVDIEELEVVLGRAVRLLELEEPKKENISADIPEQDLLMIGECEVMEKIFALIRKLALAEVNVLITGESGTGKELCARAIHFHSSRRENPFVPINCSAIPETLLESELFGYVKGAFTGAHTNKKGLIESANEGTLFLDEIGDMPKPLQAKLLRFLEDKKFQRLGDVAVCQADVRIIAATNRRDIALENNPVMRTDLYYRLSEFEIHLPPLRERHQDILLLAHKIIERNRDRFNMPKLKLSTRAQQTLLKYSWPGNIRELENKLSRAAISCVNQVIEPEDVNLSMGAISNSTYKEAKDMFERNFITHALRQAQCNVTVAAKNIGVSRPTLYDMIKKHNIKIGRE